MSSSFGTRAQSLENSTTQELIELLTLLNNNDKSFVDSIIQDIQEENLLRDYLIETNIDILFDNGYDGDNNFDSMYWFAKGLIIPVPQPLQRYIDTDEYKQREQMKTDKELFNNLHKYNIKDKIDDFKHKQIKDKFKNDRLKESRELHKKDSSFLSELIQHQRDLKKFNKYHKKHQTKEYVDIYGNKNYKLANKMRFKSYEEFKAFEHNKDGQKELINDIIEEISKTPLRWSIDFRKLNQYGKNKLRTELLELLMEEVAPRINANQHEFIIRYLINGEWHSKPLKDDTLAQLITGLQNDNVFDIVLENADGTPIFSDTDISLTTIWYYFDALEFKRLNQRNKKEYKQNKDGINRPDSYEQRNGAFFPYWNTSNLDLMRYQILHKNNNFLMLKENEKTPCIIYALCQLIPKELHGNIMCRFIKNEQQNGRKINWMCNEYNNKHLNFICKEWKIYCKVHYYDEYAIKPAIRTFERGVNKDTAKYKIELGMYKDHYFVYERTKYTRYFIQHYEELKNVRDAHKIIGKNKYNKYQRDSRVKYCLNSLELLIEMMKQGLFTQMNFRDLYVLRSPLLTIHGKEVNDNTPLNEIANVDFGYDGQMFYDFDKSPAINTGKRRCDIVYMNDNDIPREYSIWNSDSSADEYEYIGFDDDEND